MRITPKALVTGAVTGMLAIGLVASPAQAVSKAEKKQNSSIKKTSKSVTALKKTTKKTTKDLKTLATAFGITQKESKTSATTLASLTAALPTVVSSLTQLRDGLVSAGNGLTALQGALTTNIASQEYGVVQAFVGGTAIPGQILTSSDIPDDANSAVLTGRFIIPVPNGTPAATPVTLRAAVRSGEKDGTSAADPVASAGLQTMTLTDATGNITEGGGNTGVGTNVPLTSKPNAAANGAPVYPIAIKAPRSDATPNPFAFPSAADQSIELTDPATLSTLTAGPTRFTVENSSGGAGIAIVDFTVRFNDLTASATDLGA